MVLNCKEEINNLTSESVKRFQFNNKGEKVDSAAAILALKKMGN